MSGWNKGLTKETDARVARIAKAKEGKPSWNKGLTKDDHSGVAKISEAKVGNTFGSANKGRNCTWKVKISNTLKQNYEDKRYKRKYGFQNGHPRLGGILFEPGIVPWNKGLTKETDDRLAKAGQKVSCTLKERWRTEPKFRERSLKAMIGGLLKRPTCLEKKLIEIIEANNLPFKYVGNWAFLIGYKNPDFIHTKGRKVCIEISYEYFKVQRFGSRQEYEKKRAGYFSKWGWTTIFLWEEDLNNPDKIISILGIY